MAAAKPLILVSEPLSEKSLAYLRQLEEQGKVTIVRGDSGDAFV